jgi:hypothetical protein
MKVGSDWGGAGAFKPFTATPSGAQRVSDAHGRYMDAVLAGRVWVLSVVAGAATAYTGAAAGTPLLAVHNPANSQKYISVLGVSFGSVVAASAAGTVALRVYAGASVLPTGTVTNPRNMLTQVASGSAGVGFSNAALTSSTALSHAMTLNSYYWATAAGAWAAPAFFDIGGLLVIPPGNQVAVGGSAALTSATFDCSLIFEELPYLITI